MSLFVGVFAPKQAAQNFHAGRFSEPFLLKKIWREGEIRRRTSTSEGESKALEKYFCYNKKKLSFCEQNVTTLHRTTKMQCLESILLWLMMIHIIFFKIVFLIFFWFLSEAVFPCTAKKTVHSFALISDYRSYFSGSYIPLITAFDQVKKPIFNKYFFIIKTSHSEESSSIVISSKKERFENYSRSNCLRSAHRSQTNILQYLEEKADEEEPTIPPELAVSVDDNSSYFGFAGGLLARSRVNRLGDLVRVVVAVGIQLPPPPLDDAVDLYL